MTVEHQNEFSEFDFPRYEACPICHGRGLVSHPDAYEQEDCAACGGEGEVECQPFEPASQIQHVEYADVQSTPKAYNRGAKVSPQRHRWADKVVFPNKSERECLFCGLVKVSRREFEGGRDVYWTEFWRGLDRIECVGTPACEQVVEVAAP